MRIKKFIDENRPQSAVIAGGGFIGLEMAENLTEQGIAVTIVQSAKQLMPPFDGDMVAFIHSEMRKNGVNLKLGSAVSGFEEADGKIMLFTQNGEKVVADMAILAIGVVPENTLAKSIGLQPTIFAVETARIRAVRVAPL